MWRRHEHGDGCQDLAAGSCQSAMFPAEGSLEGRFELCSSKDTASEKMVSIIIHQQPAKTPMRPLSHQDN